ncbi:MAG: hypothetical protein DDT37_00982 [Firmicutes bacterium]|nr:hypothetical protein [candidate division NPL-UPA2 bacterium]
MREKQCPVCEKEIPTPLPPFCDRCGWNFNEYTQKLIIAKRGWNQLTLAEQRAERLPRQQEQTAAVDVAELNKGDLFKRDPFETLAEFKERIEGLGLLPAGEARLVKDKYDLESGRFPLQATWETWTNRFIMPKNDLYITAERQLARDVYTAGEKHLLLFRLQVNGGAIYPEATVILKTPEQLMSVQGGIAMVCPSVLRGHEDAVDSVSFSPDGRLLASGSKDQTVRLWEVSTGKELSILRGHEDPVSPVAFSPDGRLLASGSEDKTVRLWEVSSGKELSILRGHEWYVDSVAFSPDGRLLASGSWDNTVRLWEVSSGKELSVLRNHCNYVISVSFSPDGRLLASGSRDETVRLWEVSSGKELSALRGHEDTVTSVSFSPDGRLLASGSQDKTVRLWEVSSGKELSVLRGHERGVDSVAFSPDGRLLASGSWDNTVRLWLSPIL